MLEGANERGARFPFCMYGLGWAHSMLGLGTGGNWRTPYGFGEGIGGCLAAMYGDVPPGCIVGGSIVRAGAAFPERGW